MAFAIKRNAQDDSLIVEFKKVQNFNEDVLGFLTTHLSDVKVLSFTETLETTDHLKTLASFLQMNRRVVKLETIRLTKNTGITASSCGHVADILVACSHTLNFVDLSDNEMGDGMAIVVTKALTLTNPACRIERLELGKTKLGLKSASSCLSLLLRNNVSIRHLSLVNNSLGTKCIKSLCNGLRYNSTIRSLDLSMNKIGDRGINLLAETALDVTSNTVCQLEELDLTYNKLGPNGVATLAGALLQGNKNRTLLKLNLGLNRIGSTGALYLGSLMRYSSTLQELVLSRNNIGTELDGIREFAAGLKESSGCLRKLDLSWNSLTDDHVILLADLVLMGNTKLQYLNLSSNAIGNRGMIAITKVLPSDLALEELDVVGNQATDEAAIILADVWCNLILNCGYNIKGKMSMTSGRWTPRLKDLKWEKNNFTEKGRERLENAVLFKQNIENWLGEYLNETFIVPQKLIERQQFSREVDISRVLTMDFTEHDMGDDEVVALANHLAKANVQIKRIHSNNQNQNLRSHQSHDDYSFDADDSDDFDDYDDYDEDGFDDFVLDESPVRVTSMWFRGDKRLSSRGIASLATDVLAMNDKKKNGRNTLDDSTAAQIERLYIESAPRTSDQGAAALAQALKTNMTLRVLSLTNCGITADGATSLANALKQNRSLTRLNLMGNRIGDVGFQKLLRAVLLNETNHNFDESSDEDDADDGVSNTTIHRFSTRVKPHPSLRALNVAKNKITDEGLSLCLPMIALDELNLSLNQITDFGALDLAKACNESKCSLRWLMIANNQLTPKGIKTLQLFLPTPFVMDADNQEPIDSSFGH